MFVHEFSSSHNELAILDVQEKYLDFFDFIFVDADKDNYKNYHERLLKLVRPGGVIGYVNTLWNGSLVAPGDTPYPKYVQHYHPFVLEINRVLAADGQIDFSQILVGDGITLCKRIK
ncbi:hypothetical protein L7F22_069141 [Adiantum nelumboides]|nr:hypothetical protein [Adiantum nelumboides]